MVKKFFLFILVSILLLCGIIIGMSIQDRQAKYDVSAESLEIPAFSEIEIDFSHVYIKKRALPFMAGAVIDIDNDGIEELFFGGGVRQADGLFRFENERFINISDSAGLVKLGGESTYGCVVLDVDNNGFSDLLITRESGVWLYTNNFGYFTGKKLAISMEKDTVPLSVAVADINRDGHFDLYVAGYKKNPLAPGRVPFNDNEYGGESVLLLNNGDDTFSDITDTAGMAYRHNSLQGVFVDVDKDGLEDLVAVYDTGQVRTWKNMDNLQFRMVSNPNSSEFSYPMGIAVSDYNNDGLVDFFFSNAGSTIPAFIGKKDLRADQFYNPQWILFRNRGDFQFEDMAESVKLAGYEIGRGAVFEDLNLDGMDDLVVAENYPGWPLHTVPSMRLFGRLLLQKMNGEFAEVGSAAGVQNQGLAVSPLTADFNQDGYPDLVYVNIGGKSKVFLSKKGANRYLKVQLPNRVESIGAMVELKTLKGKTLYKPFISGEGVCSDQSHVLIFGLGQDKAIDVVVTYLNGKSQRKSGELFNTTVVF